jgi:hypothetical protein
MIRNITIATIAALFVLLGLGYLAGAAGPESAELTLNAGADVLVSCSASEARAAIVDAAQVRVRCFVPTPVAVATPTFTASPVSTLPPATPTPTSTASATATAAPVSTSTPVTLTPTPTPNPTSNSVASIIYDSNENCTKSNGSVGLCYVNGAFSGTPLAPHDGPLCVPSSYSWARVADIQDAAPPATSYSLGTGWGVFQYPCLNGLTVTAPGIIVSIQNVRSYVLGDGGWKPITFGAKWCSLTNTATNLNITGCPLGGHTGPSWAMPEGQVALHWASDHNSLPTNPRCAVTMYQARTNGAGVVLADAGFDWWSGSSNRGAVVGRYHRLTTAWQWINASSCTAAQLMANPPPL